MILLAAAAFVITNTAPVLLDVCAHNEIGETAATPAAIRNRLRIAFSIGTSEEDDLRLVYIRRKGAHLFCRAYRVASLGAGLRGKGYNKLEEIILCTFRRSEQYTRM
jgi:hypothetical protein